MATTEETLRGATAGPVAIAFDKDVLDDLHLSGLVPEDLAVRPATRAELAAVGAQLPPAGTSTQAYVLPYFDLIGHALPYYRVKFLGPHANPKYRGPADTPPYVYFPKTLGSVLLSNAKAVNTAGLTEPGTAQELGNFIIITEGEKKAACAVKNGFPAVAFSGVDAWRTRQLTMPDNAQLVTNKQKGIIIAKLPSGGSGADALSLIDIENGALATGMNELLNLVLHTQLTVVIIYDSTSQDGVTGTKMEVQRAAAQLGYELRFRGVPVSRIKQLILPQTTRGAKVGLDDFLVRPDGPKQLRVLLQNCLSKRVAFPRHPNPKVFIATRLQKAKLSRKEAQDVALAILSELEARGKRLRNKATQSTYYFDERTHTLMGVTLNNPRIVLHDTAFGSFLYREFNLSSVDQRVIGWLAAQFNGEPGIDDAVMHKVLARPAPPPPAQGQPPLTRAQAATVAAIKEGIAYQISDTHFVVVTPDPNQPFVFCENGTYGLLFEQGQVAPISVANMEAALAAAHDDPVNTAHWLDVLSGYNVSQGGDTEETSGRERATPEQQKILMGLLFYISPWLLRWNGTQLPVELVIGEAGSGKSSLYELRQGVITGMPRLSNLTNDIRDWYAGITSHGGVHVLDNVYFPPGAKDYRQQLSNEYCRLVTEPTPHVELRKLYTTSDVVTLPVTTTFALTAIEQPFFNADLLQRAAVFEVQAISTSHDANYVRRQLERVGGRAGWIAHHLVVLHRFLNKALYHHEWDFNYKAGHRLANYEQCLMLMAATLGINPAWIPSALNQQTTGTLATSDLPMAALGEFVAQFKEEFPDYEKRRFSVSDVNAWAEEHETYGRHRQLTNAWALGRYLKSHSASIGKAHGIYPNGTKNNKAMYCIRKPGSGSHLSDVN